jgi:hypothetical protein
MRLERKREKYLGDNDDDLHIESPDEQKFSKGRDGMPLQILSPISLFFFLLFLKEKKRKTTTIFIYNILCVCVCVCVCRVRG